MIDPIEYESYLLFLMVELEILMRRTNIAFAMSLLAFSAPARASDPPRSLADKAREELSPGFKEAERRPVLLELADCAAFNFVRGNQESALAFLRQAGLIIDDNRSMTNQAFFSIFKPMKDLWHRRIKHDTVQETEIMLRSIDCMSARDRHTLLVVAPHENK